MRALYSQKRQCTKINDHVRMLQNLVLTKLGQMALILLNYKYSPTGRIGVNASIRPHSAGICSGDSSTWMWCGHTSVNTPDPIRFPQLSAVWPKQYWNG